MSLPVSVLLCILLVLIFTYLLIIEGLIPCWYFLFYHYYDLVIAVCITELLEFLYFFEFPYHYLLQLSIVFSTDSRVVCLFLSNAMFLSLFVGFFLRESAVTQNISANAAYNMGHFRRFLKVGTTYLTLEH